MTCVQGCPQPTLCNSLHHAVVSAVKLGSSNPQPHHSQAGFGFLCVSHLHTKLNHLTDLHRTVSCDFNSNNLEFAGRFKQYHSNIKSSSPWFYIYVGP